MNKYNIGEWSEFYAFLHLLSIKFVNNNRIVNITRKKITYKICGDEVFFTTFEGITLSIYIKEIVQYKNILLNFLLTKPKKTFEVPLVSNWAWHILKTSVSPISNLEKIDLIIDLENNLTLTSYPISVKSWLGANPTLVNSSKYSTKIQYYLNNNQNFLLENNSLKNRKLVSQNTFDLLHNKNINTNLFTFTNLDLMENLSLYCGKKGLKIFSDLVLSYYLLNHTTLNSIYNNYNLFKGSLFNILKNKQFLNENFNLLPFSDVEIKSFFIDFLKMSLNNLITRKIISENLLYCLNVYNDGSIDLLLDWEDILKKYEFIIKFDTPSTNRHDFGYIYKNTENQYIFSLNFQIRLVNLVGLAGIEPT